jgi:hypothetical protein
MQSALWKPGESSGRSILESAFRQLRQKIAATEITDEHVKRAALEALERARARIEVDSAAVTSELHRMREKPR